MKPSKILNTNRSLGCLAVTMIWWHASAPSLLELFLLSELGFIRLVRDFHMVSKGFIGSYQYLEGQGT